MTVRPLIPAALMLVGLALHAPAAAQGRPALQDLVPSSTPVFVEARDVKRLVDALCHRSSAQC